MATDTQSLYTLAKCYECAGVVGQARLLKLGLLASIVLTANPLTAVDPQSLLNAANCYSCGSNASMADLFELGLLALIVQNGTGGGGGGASGVIQGNYGGATPTASPASYGVAGDLNTGNIWLSNGTAWTQYA